MRNKLAIIAVLVLVIFSAQFDEAKAETVKPNVNFDWLPCTVKDPTGTPLNVRARPNGRIVTTLKNGTLVAIDDSTAGNRWARISIGRGRKDIVGWVLREYLSCG